ncbi:glycosyltransferase family 39 protein [Candidatus Curtissbacteria bacterium]|nr:glycosyltransferase family 39 protein [Candidatus Curtissbacteria bacterium]
MKFPKIEILLLAAVLAFAVFFRFWQIRDYVVFLGDEGRDMLVMREMLQEKRLTFLGPTASVGGFYLGPIYYWMAAPFLLLWQFDPVGPAYFVAALGVATVFLLYKFLKDAVGFWPAILTSSLYATAPLILRYSRSSWNPNPLPFFALLLVYFLYLGIKKQKFIYFLGAGAAFGVCVQLHYLATILLAIAGAIIALNVNWRRWLLIFILVAAGFLITFSPFLLFEIKNGFPNMNTILEFVTRGTTVGFRTSNYVWLISNIGNIFLEELTKIKGTQITVITFWTLLLGALFGLFKNIKSDKKLIFSIGIIWFLGGLAGLRFYTGQVFDYYFGFMFPAPFLLLGLVISLFWHQKAIRAVAVLITLAAVVFFIRNSPFKFPPNRLIDQTDHVADFVIEKSAGEPFNFALITDSNSDHAYRYFLDVRGHEPLELETLVTEQLMVVCESQKCAPLGHPTWEIAGFGRAEIAGEWEIPDIGIRVFRLTHWPGNFCPTVRYHNT